MFYENQSDIKREEYKMKVGGCEKSVSPQALVVKLKALFCHFQLLSAPFHSNLLFSPVNPLDANQSHHL